MATAKPQSKSGGDFSTIVSKNTSESSEEEVEVTDDEASSTSTIDKVRSENKFMPEGLLSTDEEDVESTTLRLKKLKNSTESTSTRSPDSIELESLILDEEILKNALQKRTDGTSTEVLEKTDAPKNSSEIASNSQSEEVEEVEIKEEKTVVNELLSDNSTASSDVPVAKKIDSIKALKELEASSEIQSIHSSNSTEEEEEESPFSDLSDENDGVPKTYAITKQKVEEAKSHMDFVDSMIAAPILPLSQIKRPPLPAAKAQGAKTQSAYEPVMDAMAPPAYEPPFDNRPPPDLMTNPYDNSESSTTTTTTVATTTTSEWNPYAEETTTTEWNPYVEKSTTTEKTTQSTSTTTTTTTSRPTTTTTRKTTTPAPPPTLKPYEYSYEETEPPPPPTTTTRRTTTTVRTTTRPPPPPVTTPPYEYEEESYEEPTTTTTRRTTTTTRQTTTTQPYVPEENPYEPETTPPYVPPTTRRTTPQPYPEETPYEAPSPPGNTGYEMAQITNYNPSPPRNPYGGLSPPVDPTYFSYNSQNKGKKLFAVNQVPQGRGILGQLPIQQIPRNGFQFGQQQFRPAFPQQQFRPQPNPNNQNFNNFNRQFLQRPPTQNNDFNRAPALSPSQQTHRNPNLPILIKPTVSQQKVVPDFKPEQFPKNPLDNRRPTTTRKPAPSATRMKEWWEIAEEEEQAFWATSKATDLPPTLVTHSSNIRRADPRNRNRLELVQPATSRPIQARRTNLPTLVHGIPTSTPWWIDENAEYEDDEDFTTRRPWKPYAKYQKQQTTRRPYPTTSRRPMVQGIRTFLNGRYDGHWYSEIEPEVEPEPYTGPWIPGIRVNRKTGEIIDKLPNEEFAQKFSTSKTQPTTSKSTRVATKITEKPVTKQTKKVTKQVTKKTTPTTATTTTTAPYTNTVGKKSFPKAEDYIGKIWYR